MPKQGIALLSLLVLTVLGAALTLPSASREIQQASPRVVDNKNAASFITYIANEGVLLEAGGKKVVIDAMFRRLAGYPRPSDAIRADIENARGAFAGVDLVLATHFHGDHFDAATVGAHLAANRRARFVGMRSTKSHAA